MAASRGGVEVGAADNYIACWFDLNSVYDRFSLSSYR